MSELDSQEVKEIYMAASAFANAYTRWETLQRPHGMRRAATLAQLATLLQACHNHDMKVQEEFDAKTSLSEPPF